jgi:hypothetical protein
MATQPEINNMALFCDLENVALGVRDAKYAKFDIARVLERLLLKGKNGYSFSFLPIQGMTLNPWEKSPVAENCLAFYWP